MPNIQTKNITTLCSELGFSKDLAGGRDPTILKAATIEFRKSFIQKGHHLPISTSVSPEAQHFALAFCQESNRGATLWPSNSNGSWPCWSSEQPKIFESLAHIFALQEFNQHKNNLRKEKDKEKMPSATPTLSPERDTRGLSPYSERIMNETPIPPSGTRRRPAKNSGVPAQLNFEIDQQTILDNCESEILSLDPRKDDKPIKEFRAQWLSRAGARWPVAADHRIRTYMHDNNLYDPQAPDMKIIPLTNSLRRGTEIEECEIQLAKDFQQKTVERISELAEDMLKKGLLWKEDNTPKKLPLFKDLWVSRHGKYSPRVNGTKPVAAAKSRDVYSIDNLPPDPRPRAAPVATMASKGPQSSSTASSSGTRRKLDSANEGPVAIEQQQKKRRTNAMGTGAQAIVTPPLEQTSAFPSVDPIEEVAREDSFEAETREFTRQFFSSDNELESQQPAQAPQRMQSTSKGSRPMTPTSPVVASNEFSRTIGRSASTPRGLAPIQGSNDSNTVATSPRQMTLQPSPALSADRRQTYPTGQLPALIIEKNDGSFDNENPLSSSHFRDLDIRGFFNFVSEAAAKPRDSFDKLTFTFIFTEGADRLWLINDGDEGAWNKLQKKARFLCKLYKTRTEESDLQLVVEFGDKIMGIAA
ncbi:hypothetical protein N431DRAFT_466874 [Stipitochalara longipes BDJ]|nr:hypothetical protein N431DRAFT_466874 [Stipitochalara longipes BDJ]